MTAPRQASRERPASYLYRLLARNVLPRIHTSPAGFRAAVQKLVNLARETRGILLPVHDLEIWKAYEEHGDGWLRALRPLSDAATRGYESNR